MPTRDIVVVGASSGGIEALNLVVSGLPSDLPAAVFVVQHTAAHSENYLATMLGRNTPLAVKTAADGESIRPGVCYIAPADNHLLVDRDQVFLSRGPRENRVRPAVDPLFRSAALSHGRRVIGVILSGSLDDGTAGLTAVKDAGGIAVVQDPATALTPDMPRSAISYVAIDHIVPAAGIGPLIDRLTREEIGSEGSTSADIGSDNGARREVEIMQNGTGDIDRAIKLGKMIPASCPDCGGPLWEMDGPFSRFRCHTGHAFTARHLVAGLQDAEEQSLWVALRVMEERARMLRRLADQDKQRGNRYAGEAFADKAVEAEEHVQLLRKLLTSRPHN